MVLQLDEEPPGLEHALQRAERFASRARPLLEDLLRDVPAHARAEPHEPLAVLAQDLEIDPRPHCRRRRVDPAAAHEAHEVSIALLSRREQHEGDELGH